MSTFRRRGHWRRGKNGTKHWVSGHSVSRDGRGIFEPYSRYSTLRPSRLANDPSPSWRTRVSTARTSWNPPPEDPNARCPVCLEPVWFFRNERGGCAYFDAIGKPWPLHPCMEQLQTGEDRRAPSEARSAFERALLSHPRFAARQAARDEVRMSAARSSEPTVPATVSGASAVSRPTKVVKSLDW